MRYCFDLDDTISRHRNRDYANAEPISDVVRAMRAIKARDKEAYIIIHTARGMNSCKGDVAMAEEKNRQQIETWLREHDVPYDEIVFGKPLADVYVDDKAMKPHELVEEPLQEFRGFSGKSTYRVGNVVIKECEDAQEQADWYAECERLTNIRVPHVHSVTLGKLYLEYVNASKVYDNIRGGGNVCLLVYEALWALRAFKEAKLEGENDVEQYASVIEDKAEAIGYDAKCLCDGIRHCEILKRRTFCHGDFTFSNMLRTRPITLIDPSKTYGLRTWLADAGKMQACLTGLNAIIEGDKERELKEALGVFRMQFGQTERRAIDLLEQTHYIRVAYSAWKQGKTEECERLKAHLW